MKAIMIAGPGDIRMIETEKPKVGPEDILAKVSYSGICGTDLAIYSGDMSLIREGFIKYPVRIGHEWSGIVEEIGDKVAGFEMGDHVVSDTGVTCGVCGHCLSGHFGLCRNIRSLGTVNCWDGSFADYIVMPYRHLHKLPYEIGLDEAALIEPATIALAGIKKASITRDSNVLVIGTGAIGLAAVALARHAGAKKVLLSGRKQYKLDVGKVMGADATVNVTKNDLKDFIYENTSGDGVNVIIETSGNIETINQCIDVAARFGTIALIGFYETILNGFNIDKLVANEIQIKGVMGEFGLVEQIINIMMSGALSLKPLITHRFRFDKSIGAIVTANERNDTKIKMLVEM